MKLRYFNAILPLLLVDWAAVAFQSSSSSFLLIQNARSSSRHHQHEYAPKIGTSALSAAVVESKRSNNEHGNASVEFPPPLSKVERLKRATTFWSTALPIVASYYGIISRLKLQEILGGKLDQGKEEELWKALHTNGAEKLAETITDLKGFYVKTAQIISTRQDLFPAEYTDALAGFTDNLDPMPFELAKAVVCSELLNADETFDDVFAEFDETPLGAASVAQVHRAVLTEKYGGREVAVKIQRPSIESKLMGDIANLKAIAYQFRNPNLLPLDYYTVFSELETQLARTNLTLSRKPWRWIAFTMP